MILKEAMLGGVWYVDYLKTEKAMPESDRVSIVYRALTNREKLELLDQAQGPVPKTESILEKCVTSIRNLTDSKGNPLDTLAKLLAYPDGDHTISYMLFIAAHDIWRNQGGNQEMLKNSESPSTAGAKAISTTEQPSS